LIYLFGNSAEIPGKIYSNINEDMLQCSYCFDFFHRHACSLSMNNKSYFQALRNRTWACPVCVPIYVPQILKKKVASVSLHDFLTKLFSLLNKICSSLNVNLDIDKLNSYKHMNLLVQEFFVIDNG
jgi:hypothetical protein